MFEIALGFFLLLLLFFFGRKRNDNLPPEPWFGLPFVGHLFFIGSQPHQTFQHWSHRYGPVFTAKLGNFRTVVVNDGKILKQAFSSGSLSGRPRIKVFDDWSRRKGIAFSDGPHAEEQRRFAIKTFKDLTRPGESMELRILEATESLLQMLESTKGKPLNVHHLFNESVVNSLLSVLTGIQLVPGDPEIDRLTHVVSSAAQNQGIMVVLGLYIPFLSRCFPNWTGYNNWIKSGEDCRKFLRPIFAEHQSSFVPRQWRDVMDHYVDKLISAKDKISSFNDIGQVEDSFRDFLAAGMDTTAIQLEWIILFMAKYPKVQERLILEIDSKLGGRVPSLNDRAELVYTEAVLQESLRLATIIPFGLFHSAMEDCELGDYRIPKGVMVIGNLYAANRDPCLWSQPEQYRPDRFIDKEGNLATKQTPVFAFGTGKRSCIGEGLARSQLFLFAVRIFQRFIVRAVGELEVKHRFSVTVAPPPFQVVFSKRNFPSTSPHKPKY